MTPKPKRKPRRATKKKVKTDAQEATRLDPNVASTRSINAVTEPHADNQIQTSPATGSAQLSHSLDSRNKQQAGRNIAKAPAQHNFSERIALTSSKSSKPLQDSPKPSADAPKKSVATTSSTGTPQAPSSDRVFDPKQPLRGSTSGGKTSSESATYSMQQKNDTTTTTKTTTKARIESKKTSASNIPRGTSKDEAKSTPTQHVTTQSKSKPQTPPSTSSTQRKPPDMAAKSTSGKLELRNSGQDQAVHTEIPSLGPGLTPHSSQILPALFPSHTTMSDDEMRTRLYNFLAKPSNYIKEYAEFAVFEAKGHCTLEPKEGTKPLATFKTSLTQQQISLLDQNRLPRKVTDLVWQFLSKAQRQMNITLQIICPLDLDLGGYQLCSDGTVLKKDHTVVPKPDSWAMGQKTAKAPVKAKGAAITDRRKLIPKSRSLVRPKSNVPVKSSVNPSSQRREQILQWYHKDLPRIIRNRTEQSEEPRVVYQGAYLPHFFKASHQEASRLNEAERANVKHPSSLRSTSSLDTSEDWLVNFVIRGKSLVTKELQYADTLSRVANTPAFQAFGANTSTWHAALVAQAVIEDEMADQGVKGCSHEDILWKDCKTLLPE